jgi:hypothetical protein
MICTNIYEYIIIRPLKNLYIHGPMIMNFGFWQGRKNEEICRDLTQQSELFWKEHHLECKYIIDNHFHSYLTFFETIFYFYCLFKMLKCLQYFVITNSCPPRTHRRIL